MLYTKKGDNGTTKLFNCPQGERISKDSFVFEVLGTFDELNSNLGYVKVLTEKTKDTVFMNMHVVPYRELIETFQHHLFSIQAEIGGSDTHLSSEDIVFLEKLIYEIETVLPPINSFIVAGGGEAGAYLDIVRALARRAERLLVALAHKKERVIAKESLIYMNRLSSALYALARFANYQEGYSEHPPRYT